MHHGDTESTESTEKSSLYLRVLRVSVVNILVGFAPLNPPYETSGKGRHDVGSEQFDRAHRLGVAHRAEREIADEIGRARRLDRLGDVVAHLARRAGDRVAVRLERVPF